MNNRIVLVTEHQGIDLDKIEAVFKKPVDGIFQGMSDDEIGSVKQDIVELVDHVREDGLLDRVADARKNMKEQDDIAALVDKYFLYWDNKDARGTMFESCVEEFMEENDLNIHDNELCEKLAQAILLAVPGRTKITA